MCGRRKTGTAEQRRQRHVAAAGEQRAHARLALPGQRDHRRAEEIDLAVGYGANEETGCQIAAQPQMLDECCMFLRRRASRSASARPCTQASRITRSARASPINATTSGERFSASPTLTSSM